jgi:hypothetical protein
MDVQGCWGVDGAPVARWNSLKDPQEPKKFGLQSLKKYSQKGKVQVQTTNCMRLGEGKRAIDRAGGLGGIGASGHIWQQIGSSKFSTFFSPRPRWSQKVTKKVPSRRLGKRRKASKIRPEMQWMGVRGIRGNLFHVSWRVETFSNPTKNGSKT